MLTGKEEAQRGDLIRGHQWRVSAFASDLGGGLEPLTFGKLVGCSVLTAGHLRSGMGYAAAEEHPRRLLEVGLARGSVWRWARGRMELIVTNLNT
jgi:hypothetical protein